jgi:hypothetical protein
MRDRRGLEKMREPQSSSLESAKGMPLSGPRNAIVYDRCLMTERGEERGGDWLFHVLLQR